MKDVYYKCKQFPSGLWFKSEAQAKLWLEDYLNSTYPPLTILAFRIARWKTGGKPHGDFQATFHGGDYHLDVECIIEQDSAVVGASFNLKEVL